MCRNACVFWFRVFYYDIGFDIVLAHRCWWKYIFYVQKNGRRDTKCPPLRFGGHTPPVTATGFLRTFSRIILYKIENTAVAATRFFAGEVEIFDFVTERVKRCIAAKRGRGGGSLKTHNDGWKWNLIKCLGSIFYEHSVVVGNIYSMYTKMGGGM